MRTALLATVITLMGAVSQVVADHGKATVLIENGNIMVYGDNEAHGRDAVINCGNATVGSAGCSQGTHIVWTVLNKSGKSVDVEIDDPHKAKLGEIVRAEKPKLAATRF